MPNYFANGNRFRPPRKETELPILDSITGVLEYCDIRPGNNPSGRWFIIRVANDDGRFNAYFDPEYISSDDIRLLESLQNRKIKLFCEKGIPVINVISVESEGDLRAELLKGLAAGKIEKEDLPALLEFGKGDVALFAKWQLFQKQIHQEDIVKAREEIDQDIEKTLADIKQLKAKLGNLKCIHQEITEEIDDMLSELFSALTFLQGEDGLQGTKATSYSRHSDNLVPIGEGQVKLLEAFEKFKTRKGVYVICGNTIHKIHHAYLEDKGRAFLLGSSREFLRSNPDKVKEIIDKIYCIRYGDKMT